MTKTVGRILINGIALAMGMWLVSQIGLMISFFTYGFIGWLLYPLFFILATWPSMIVSLFRPQELPNNYYESAYAIQFGVSLMGWIVLGILIAFSRHIIQQARTRTNK